MPRSSPRKAVSSLRGRSIWDKPPIYESPIVVIPFFKMDMEKFPSPENHQEHTEKIEKEKVLEMLRAHGFDHPETKEIVTKWAEQREASVMEKNTRRAQVLFEIERSELYLAAGDAEGALRCLEDARFVAHQENEHELYGQIMKRMDEIEEKWSGK